MKKKPKFQKPSKFKLNKKVVILGCVAAVILILLIVMLVMLGMSEEEPEETLPTETTQATTTVETEETTEETQTETVETDPGMLEDMAALYQQNPDIAAWITIEGTKLDYPVMYTPDDEEKYIYKDFEEKYHFAGLPFIDKDCSIDPESDNIVIYGHNMNDGSAFNTLMSYVGQKFWEEHPTISYKTLYEERTYEIVAAFYDRIYYKSEDCFKFYEFIDAETEEEYNEAIEYYKKTARYDTGVTAEYGDHLITLVTCSYHVDYGRFVVVAREVVEEPEVETTE